MKCMPGAEVLEESEEFVKIVMKADQEKGVFPLKVRDEAINAGFQLFKAGSEEGGAGRCARERRRLRCGGRRCMRALHARVPVRLTSCRHPHRTHAVQGPGARQRRQRQRRRELRGGRRRGVVNARVHERASCGAARGRSSACRVELVL